MTNPKPNRANLFGWMNTSKTFTALKYPNYRLWFYGQMASLLGTWMQATAQGYLIYQLTHSEAFLGYVGFIGGLPVLLMLFGGVVSDRMSRRDMMVVTQSAMMILAFVLAGLTFARVIQPWHILVLAFLLGLANAFDTPARMAFTLEMVKREDLNNAIALNAAMFNVATAVGPAVGGIAYAALGPGWCFTINGISFIAVIVALVLMKLAPVPVPTRKIEVFRELTEGIRYVFQQRTILTIILLLGVTTLLGNSFGTLTPAWAVTELKGDATTNGLLLSARGFGALAGALVIASMGRFNYRGKLLMIGSIVFPISIILFALTRWLPLALVFLVLAGLSTVFFYNLCNSLVQTLVVDELRGRVMSLYSLVFFGLMTVGSLMIGNLAEILGNPLTILSMSASLLVVCVVVWFAFPQIRKLE